MACYIHNRIAAAQVCGLAAYLQQVKELENVLGIDTPGLEPADRVELLKHYIEERCWRRLDNGEVDNSNPSTRPKAIWNRAVLWGW
jgi:hypothetical protein